MGASVLSIYNSALTMVGQRTLRSLSDEGGGEAKRLLDRNWCDVRDRCLEAGSWSFAKRSVMIEPDEGFEPAFGYDYAFAKPCDWKRTHVVSDNAMMQEGLVPYLDQAGHWYANVSPIYVIYISCHDHYGGDVGKWSAHFAHAMALLLAAKMAPKAVGSEEKAETLDDKGMKAIDVALAFDAANLGSQPTPTSSWVASRGRRGGYRGR